MLRKLLTLTLLMMTFNFFGCGNNNSEAEISVTELAEKVDQNHQVYLLDVRTEREFEAGRLAFADGLIPYDSLTHYKDRLPQDKETPIYCFCRSGRRSGIATEYLRSIGYINTYNVKGGIIAWQNSGFGIVSGPLK